MARVPQRILWAVRTAAATGAASVLEVGCGRGHALALLAAELPGARLAGVDRSATAVAAAEERGRALVEASRLQLVRAELAGVAAERFEAAPFDVVFAVNVNAFWLEPRAELAAARSLLAPEGRLLLFYEPPSAAQGLRIRRALTPNLAGHGFAVHAELEEPLGSVSGVGVAARPA